MEYKEYKNPLEKDYDIKASLDENYGVVEPNVFAEQLVDLVGILEDVSEEDLINNYGITLEEYLNPNEEVIYKVKEALNERGMHK